MHSSRMRTTRSLTVSPYLSGACVSCMPPPCMPSSCHACPLPCMPLCHAYPPATHIPPATHAHCHACPPATHAPPLATHAPPPPHTHPLPCTPPTTMHAAPCPCGQTDRCKQECLSALCRMTCNVDILVFINIFFYNPNPNSFVKIGPKIMTQI